MLTHFHRMTADQTPKLPLWSTAHGRVNLVPIARRPTFARKPSGSNARTPSLLDLGRQSLRHEVIQPSDHIEANLLVMIGGGQHGMAVNRVPSFG